MRPRPDLSGRSDPGSASGASAWPVMVSAVLLSGAVAAAVAAATLRFVPNDPPRIASVRLGEITAAYAVKAAGEKAPAATAAQDARAWGLALEQALGRVALKHDAVLLPARAVAAGAPDLTAEVEAALAVLLAGSAAGAAARPSGSNP